MAESTALLTPPTPQPAGEKPSAAPAMAEFLARSLEDLDLAERVERALHATGRGPLRGVEVSVRARVVVLGGRVPSYFLKQVAQATALAVPGIEQIHNDLAVVKLD